MSDLDELLTGQARKSQAPAPATPDTAGAARAKDLAPAESREVVANGTTDGWFG